MIEDRIYNQRDFDKSLVIDQRTQLVARKVSDFLKATDRFAKTIVFCEDIDLGTQTGASDGTTISLGATLDLGGGVSPQNASRLQAPA